MRRPFFQTCVAVAAMLSLATSAGAALPMLVRDGTRLVDPSGHAVVLKGCNLGNWLILESWLFGGTMRADGKPFTDGVALLAALEKRFGAERAAALMDAFRQSWVTPRDFELIKSFGFNVVRLPFDYRLLQDDAAPDHLRPDAFRWLDHALSMAEAAGVYVILDLHGAPGGQSKQDHTGQANQNGLWHNATNQDRTVALWSAIAERYKGRTVVAAYDLINEPYGDNREDVRPELAALMPRLAAAIRDTGDRHVIFYAGALNGGVAFYGNPNAPTGRDVGFTEHYYPGLFGGKPALETHARMLGAELPAKAQQIERIGVPYLVGEFNVVLASVSPHTLMRRYVDRFAEYGWASTMWSYKLVKIKAGAGPSAWYMATNADALPTVDVASASYEEIDSFFRNFAAAPLAVNEPLRTELTTPTPAPLALAKYTSLPTTAPSSPPSDPPGFTSTDIGVTPPGHTAALPGDGVEIIAGGNDIHAAQDAFRYVAKPVHGPDSLTTTITGFTETDPHAKAGLMARWGDGTDAAMVLSHVFPDGTVAFLTRPTAGGPTTQRIIAASLSLPVQLRLEIIDGKAVARYRTDRGDWQPAGRSPVPTDTDYRLGLAVTAHDDAMLTNVTALLGRAGDKALPAAGRATTRPAGTSLLTNGSFEHAGTAADLAAGWQRWGDGMNRTAGPPAHDGDAAISYPHDRVAARGSAGLWQDVPVKIGERYAFTLFARHDPAAAGTMDAATFELRLESVTPDGPLLLNSQEIAVARLATGRAWTRLTVSGTATSDTLRVIAVLNPAAGPRGGRVQFDDATLTPSTDGH